MARKRRDTNTFNLSFLDIMSCGFGAVVLVFLIMNHAIEEQQLELNENLLAEVNLLEYDVTEGVEGLVRLRNILSDVDLKIVEAQGRATRIAEEQSEWEAKIAELQQDGFVADSEVDDLKAELRTLEDEVEKLREASEDASGSRARKVLGEGNRQYLTGLNLGGRRIAILVDTSSSMLADRLVQIIRLRNMGDAVQRSADKWVRTVSTVDWLTAQLPVAAKYQLITFDTEASFALPETRGQWLAVSDRDQLDRAADSLRDITPNGGTSLENAFLAMQQLSPPPDNIFLITDGLPTQGTKPPRASKVSGRERVAALPPGDPGSAQGRAGEHHPGTHGGRSHGGLGTLAPGHVDAGLPPEPLEGLAVSRRRGARAPEGFSLSFLDVICCGFGAVILLLMITKTVEPQIIEASTTSLEGRLADLQEQLFEIRGETRILNRDLNAKQEQLSEYEERIAILNGQVASARSRYDSVLVQSSSNAVITEQLAQAKQELSEEMERLLGRQYQAKNQLIGGIPVDSEYIIFIIDTSGSMRRAWGRVLNEVEATLSIYPEVKGIQVMNDMGNYLFSRYRGKWIPDTPSRRKLILRNLSGWHIFSNSSPVEGITAAIRTFYDPDKKISIYVFGDEFSGNSIEEVVSTVDRINAEDADGNRRVRIHAVGFPVVFSAQEHLWTTGIRFATLMRELTHRNGGTFVALNDYN